MDALSNEKSTSQVGQLLGPENGAEAGKATPGPLIPQPGKPESWPPHSYGTGTWRRANMPPPKLHEQYRERLRVKHDSLRTEDASPH